MGKNVEIAKVALESLSADELREVLQYINEKMYLKLQTPGGSDVHNLERYVDEMSAIIGKDLRTRRREHDLAWGRFIVAYQLITEGWTFKIIGSLFGMDRSTIFHARDQVANMLSYPNVYPAEYALYKEFKKRIRDDKMRLAG